MQGRDNDNMKPSIVSSYPAARLRVIRAERVAGVRE
jgi:hypothetical protein